MNAGQIAEMAEATPAAEDGSLLTITLDNNEMGQPVKKSKKARATIQPRPRTTRSKNKFLSDPAQNTLELNKQLRSMGWYASPTIGDGNCLFRALSDQIYGHPNQHAELRRETCDWIEQHSERYAPFVAEDEFGSGRGKGLEGHLSAMREDATYGGHMELSAVAHSKKLNIKVIQPGVVYVIEWNADAAPSSSAPKEEPEEDQDNLSNLSDRERRRILRERKKPGSSKNNPRVKSEPEEITIPEEEINKAPLYVCYHDWEHYSSIRNINGPHTGPPLIREDSNQDEHDSPVIDTKPSKLKRKEKPIAVKLEPVDSASALKRKTKSKVSSSNNNTPDPMVISPIKPTHAISPTNVPLPSSSSSCTPSPVLSSSVPIFSPPDSSSTEALLEHTRLNRSPKRSFDLSMSGDGDEESEGSVAKRTRRSAKPNTKEDQSIARRTRSSLSAAGKIKVEPQDVPTLRRSTRKIISAIKMEIEEVRPKPASESSASSSSSGRRTTATPDSVVELPLGSPGPSMSISDLSDLSELSDDEDDPIPPNTNHLVPVEETPVLTRRQRKVLGLPKPRPSAGKIIIPGGRFRGVRTTGGASLVKPKPVTDNGEWKTNGAGRVDVRGFRELKI